MGGAERIGPDSAGEVGLAVPAGGGALAAAKARASAIAALPQAALEGYVELHREDLRAALDQHLARCAEIQADLVATEGFRQRAEALLAS